MPSAHDCFAFVPPGQCVPGSQLWQIAGREPEAGAVSTVPASHAEYAVHESWFGDDERVPSAQAPHPRSDVLLGADVTWVLGEQLLHVVHASALTIVLKVPLAQAEHTRSFEADGWRETYVPGRQFVSVMPSDDPLSGSSDPLDEPMSTGRDASLVDEVGPPERGGTFSELLVEPPSARVAAPLGSSHPVRYTAKSAVVMAERRNVDFGNAPMFNGNGRRTDSISGIYENRAKRQALRTSLWVDAGNPARRGANTEFPEQKRPLGGAEKRRDFVIRMRAFGASLADVTDPLRQALRDADWESILPGLLGYAANRLRRVGWGAGRDEEPSKLSVEQLVNMAVEACLDGSRVWNPEAVDFPGFLRGIMRSLTSSEKKSVVRSRTHAQADFERIVPPATSPEDDALEEEGRQQILGTIEAAIGNDAELRALYEAIVDGSVKREEIAASLGWSVDRVTAARIKLQRRLVKQAPEQFAPALEKRRRTS